MFSPKTVECETCKHIVRKEVAQVITSNIGDDLYYCPEHKKPYEEIRRQFARFSFGGDGINLIDHTAPCRYFKRMEVSADGVPLGFAPKKK